MGSILGLIEASANRLLFEVPPITGTLVGMDWHKAIDQITPHVVSIATPQGSGTGWLVSVGRTTSLCVIATAAHVVDHAHYWEQPIRINHPISGKSVLLRAPDRAVNLNEKLDTAGIILDRSTLGLPDAALPLIEVGKYIKQGVEIGWLGFPAVSISDLCFFSGRISAYRQKDETYLVDGVAINGVSGGPAFEVAGNIRIIGVVSAYIPNRATGDVLPGVAVVRDVTQLQDLAGSFKDFDDAKAQETPAQELPPPPPPSDVDGPQAK